MMVESSNETISAGNTSGKVSWNISVEQLLLENMGPRGKDTASAVILTIVYVLIFLSGSLGNICTCIVIVRNSCMQTTTNYYLFSLAVSDLLLLFFGLPPELFSIWKAYPWRFGEAFCYLRPTILELTSYASVLTITAFTVERYIAICRPLLSQKIAVLSRAVKVIMCIWLVSLLAALPYAVHTRLYYAVTWPPTGQPVADSLVCSIPEKWLEGRMTYMFQISTFLFFLAPVTLIICLYILIGVAVRRSPLSRGASADCSHTNIKHVLLPQQPRRVVIRMLVAVTVAFIICWAPFHTQRLMVLYVHQWTPEMLTAQSHIFYISGVLYFVSATVNPILYNVISRRYRVAFRQTIFSPCSKGKSAKSRQLRSSSNVHQHAAYCQQGHSLLDKDSRVYSNNRPSRVSLNSVVTRKANYDIVRQSHLEQLTSPLCPDILNCRKAKVEKTANIEETNASSENMDSFSDEFCKLNFLFTDNVNSKNSTGSAENSHARLTVKYVPKCSPSESIMTRNQSDCSGAHHGHCVADLDSNYNSECDNPNRQESLNRHFPSIHDELSFQDSMTPDRLDVARPSGTTSPMCKYCLSDSSSSNGYAPYNTIDSYRVGYGVSKPHSRV